MNEKIIGTFLWGNANVQTFLTGTDLVREALDCIQFANPYMPAGTAIHEWYSYTNYQANRDLPVLPFLYAGRKYRLEPQIETVPPDTFLLEIRFFDRLEQLMERTVLYPPDYSFIYPKVGYYYTIRLTNAGCDQLTFHNFKLIEVNDNGK